MAVKLIGSGLAPVVAISTPIPPLLVDIKEFKGFIVASHRNILASWSTGNVAWRVAIGPAGNEVVISDGNVTSNDASEKGARFASAFNNVSIPSGSRVSISASAPSSNGDFTNDYVLYGVY